MGSLGKVKVDDVIRIPSAVKRFFDLHEGDYLEFYSSMEDLDKENDSTVKGKHVECMVVKIVRTKGKKK